jgi:DNA helicase-4
MAKTFSSRSFAIKKRQIETDVFNFISLRRGVKERKARAKYKELFTYSITKTLNTSQQKVATSFAPETLVVAGAGTGKTSALIGRSKYLIADGRVSGPETLLLAFNKKAAIEIAERAEEMGLEVVSRTFHGFARQVISKGVHELGDSSPSDFNSLESLEGIAFSEEKDLTDFINKFFESGLDESSRGLLQQFFSQLLVPYFQHDEFKNIEEYAQFVRSGIPITLAGDRVKSHGEWLISNYLFCNQIRYEYEAPFEETKGTGLWYRPDFKLSGGIYIEYFGIDKNNKTLPWINAEKYVEEMESKVAIHARHKTHLIKLSYQDLLDGKLLRKLAKCLGDMQIPIQPLDDATILDAANKAGYTNKLFQLTERFLGFYRAANYQGTELIKNCKTERELVFTKIFLLFYETYLKELSRLKQTDFTGLIIEATKILNETQNFLPFKHIMVDEFQDISKDRWSLIESLRANNPTIEFTFVGDDWQAINEFAGSDPEIMIRLGNWERKREQLFLNETFRMPQSLCQYSGEFVMKNSRQIPKALIAKGDTATNENSLNFYWNTDLFSHVDNIKKVITNIGADAADPNCELFIVARYNKNLPKLFEVDDMWAGQISISTIHRAKGLEADHVIVLDVNSSGPGFPSLIQDDPLLNLVRDQDFSYPHASERRVFYVGITRARKATHVVSSIKAPSTFALEIKESGNGQHLGFEDSKTSNCPGCGSGWLIEKVNVRGLSCTNWPVCRFRTPACLICGESTEMDLNNPRIYSCEFHPQDGVKRCKKCFFGAYEVKSGKRGNFFGCHLWASTGCLGTEDVPEDTDLRPLPKKKVASKTPKPSSGPVNETRIEPLSRNGKRWTKEEDLLAVELFNNGFELEEVAENLGRRTTAIRGRFVNWVQLAEPRLSFQIDKRSSDYERHDQEWTVVEKEELLGLWQDKCELLEITETLQRPKHQLILMLFDLNQFKIDTKHVDEINKYYAPDLG